MGVDGPAALAVGCLGGGGRGGAENGPAWGSDRRGGGGALGTVAQIPDRVAYSVLHFVQVNTDLTRLQHLNRASSKTFNSTIGGWFDCPRGAS